METALVKYQQFSYYYVVPTVDRNLSKIYQVLFVIFWGHATHHL